jgi:uracil DNA glycosylase
MSNDSKIKSTINNLTAKYSGSSWEGVLTPIFQTEEFDLAINQLFSDFQAGQPFTPTFKGLFKSMDLCKLEDVKVVFVNAYPFDEKDIADGLAFSGQVTAFHNAINNITNSRLDGCLLEYLPGQEGVLLLNASITCPIGKKEDHLPMWKPVFEKLIADIAYKTMGTIFVFVGKEVEYMGKAVRKGQYKFFLPEMPGNTEWNDLDVFNKINSILKKSGKEPVNW